MPRSREPSTRWFWSWLPALLVMVGIWTLSSFSLRGAMPDLEVPFRDKGLHFVAYAVLGFWVAHGSRATWLPAGASRGRGVTTLLAAWAITTVWGLFDEVHQSFVPGRNADVMDLVADALGASVGASLGFVLGAWGRRRTKRGESAGPGNATEAKTV